MPPGIASLSPAARRVRMSSSHTPTATASAGNPAYSVNPTLRWNTSHAIQAPAPHASVTAPAVR